jgi:hypothetical protein
MSDPARFSASFAPSGREPMAGLVPHARSAPDTSAGTASRRADRPGCRLLPAHPAGLPPPPSWIAPRATIFASYVPGAGWSIVTPPVAADVTIETVAPGGGAGPRWRLDPRQRRPAMR